MGKVRDTDMFSVVAMLAGAPVVASKVTLCDVGPKVQVIIPPAMMSTDTGENELAPVVTVAFVGKPPETLTVDVPLAVTRSRVSVAVIVADPTATADTSPPVGVTVATPSLLEPN